MIETVINLLRALVYLWIIFEAIFLTLLYKMAWSNMKRSGIILSLHFIFLSMAIFFVGLAILPIVQILNIEAYTSLTPYLVVPAIPIALALRRFRIKSLEEDMPDQAIKIAKKIKEKKNGK